MSALQAAAGATPPPPTRPRDAASLILLRGHGRALEVLLGRREPRSRFMPSIWVFPGGGVDRCDALAPALSELDLATSRHLEAHTSATRARALGIAALRETFEETGLAVGRAAADRMLADLAALSYVGRAITPATSAIRFHARFFMARASRARGRLRGNGELLDLRWFRLPEALELPIIDVTHAMLEEVARRAPVGPRTARETTGGSLFIRYRGERPMIGREG